MLFPKSGASAYLNHRVVLGMDSAIASHLAGIKAYNDRLDDRYLFYALNLVDAREIDQESKYPSLRLTQLKALTIPLPPIEEQKRIVAVLNAAFAKLDCARANVEANLADAEELRHNTIRKTLSDHAKVDAVSAKLIEVCEVYQPKTISKKQLVEDGQYEVYGANGPIGRYSQYNHDSSQVLVTCRGATCGTVNVSPPYCWITGNAMVVRPRDNRLESEFLRLIMQYSVEYSDVITGSAQPQITRKSLGPVRIAVPRLDIQSQVINHAAEVEEKTYTTRRLSESQLADLTALRQSLLQRAFAGELT